MLTLQCNLRQEQKPELLMTLMSEMAHSHTIFPMVEDYLGESTDHQNALLMIAGKKRMERYWSVIDMVFAEVFQGEWREGCLRYYKDDGPPLRELISDETRAKMEAILLITVIRAYKLFCQERRMKWPSFVQYVFKVITGKAA
jgi:hypothetical protein